MERPAPNDNLFLPNFCAPAMVLAVVVLSELFAFILTLAPLRFGDDFWRDLAVLSLYMQWVGLSGAAMLCLLRPRLSRINNVAAAVISYLLLLTLIVLFSDLAFRVAEALSLPTFASTGKEEFLLRNLAIGAIVAALVLRYLYVQHQWLRRLKTETEARVQALQARIRPHFLFNSMNTIASLVRARPDEAEAAVEDLSDLFRASLGDAKLIPLREEVALAKRYQGIEELRLGERLSVRWELDDVPDDALLPALTLQPLLENAVYHGVEPLPEGGTVTVSGRKENDRLELALENPLAPGGGQPRHQGNNMALANIRERLAAHFDNRAGLNARETGDGRYRVTLKLPYRNTG